GFERPFWSEISLSRQHIEHVVFDLAHPTPLVLVGGWTQGASARPLDALDDLQLCARQLVTCLSVVPQPHASSAAEVRRAVRRRYLLDEHVSGVNRTSMQTRAPPRVHESTSSPRTAPSRQQGIDGLPTAHVLPDDAVPIECDLTLEPVVLTAWMRFVDGDRR